MSADMIYLLRQEFEELKRREVEEDAPHEKDTTLPGWVCLFLDVS